MVSGDTAYIIRKGLRTLLELSEFIPIKNQLISAGRFYAVRRKQQDKDYVAVMADLGYTGQKNSIKQDLGEILLELDTAHYISGPEYDEYDLKNGFFVKDETVGSYVENGRNVWIFRLEREEMILYIKLKDERLARGCVCISFHEAYH